MSYLLVTEKAIQMVMQAEWLACFWCISNQDQGPGLPGCDDIILKYFLFEIVLFIHWLYLRCFYSFIYTTDVILPKFLIPDKIIVLNKQ